MGGTPPLARITGAVGRLWRGDATRQAMWLTVPFGVQQVVRLATNVVLARLLAPEIFGVMVLINTLRTGTELLSDVGVSQSVVRSPHAHDPAFLDTAWTVQALRGAALTLLALLAAWPIAQAYGNPQLVPIIALVGSTFFLTGLSAAKASFLWQRDMRVKQRAIYDLSTTIGVTVITIGLAAWWGNLWALVWGLVLGQIFSTSMTYVLTRSGWPVWRLDRTHLAEILNFGKWVFLSTAIYFAAISADKFYFSAVLPLTVVGIYGVAKTFSDMLGALAQRLGSFLVFPKVVELRQRGDGVADGFRRKRRLALLIIAAAIAGALAVSDQLILLLYDTRYHGAAFMLPVLLAGVWFSVLAAFAEATLFGLDRPQASASGNAVKFLIMIVGLPLLVPTHGVLAGLLILNLAEIGRWLVLGFALRGERLSSVFHELLLTVAIGGAAVALKMALGALGLVPTLAAWWSLGSTVTAG